MDFKSEFQQTAAEEGSFKLIEVGEYEAEIVDCKLDLTKEPNRLTFVYQITDGEYQGHKLFGNYQLEGRGIGFLKKDLTTLGLDFSEVGSPEDIASLVWDAMPTAVVIYVAQKEWQGKMYNNVYLNDLLPDSAHTVATSTTKGPTNQKEADRQAKIAKDKVDHKHAEKDRGGPGRVGGNKAAQQTQRKPINKAPQTRKPAPRMGKHSADGEPDFGDDSEIPF